MASLPELQAAFACAVLDAGGTDFLVGDAPALERRLAAYRRNVTGNWVHALRATYPVCERLVGGAFFLAAAHRYATERPSTVGDLNEYGRDFDAFLRDYPPAADLPYLAEVARLEWAVQECYYAADVTPADLAGLAALPEEERPAVRFAMAPAARRIDSAFPLARIWQAHQEADVPAIEFPPGPHHALAWRAGGRVLVDGLEPAEAGLFDRLAGGAALADALASVPQLADPSATLARLVLRGALTFTLPGGPGK